MEGLISIDKKQFNAWKAKHGTIFNIDVYPDGINPGEADLDSEEEKPLQFWFKKPSLNTIKAFTKTSQQDPVTGIQVLFKNTLLNKDLEKYADDPDVIIPIGQQLEAVIEQRRATIKKH